MHFACDAWTTYTSNILQASINRVQSCQPVGTKKFLEIYELSNILNKKYLPISNFDKIIGTYRVI